MFPIQVADKGKEVSPFSTQTSFNAHMHGTVTLTQLYLIPHISTCSASPELQASEAVRRRGLHVKDRVGESRGSTDFYATSN